MVALTVLSSAALYWRDSHGPQLAWISSASGLAFTIGGLAAIAALVGGMVLIGPSITELTASGEERTDAQRDRLARAEGRMRLTNRLELPLILLAALTMAVRRYL